MVRRDIWDMVDVMLVKIGALEDRISKIEKWVNEQEKMLAEELDDDYLIRGRKI